MVAGSSYEQQGQAEGSETPHWPRVQGMEIDCDRNVSFLHPGAGLDLYRVRLDLPLLRNESSG